VVFETSGTISLSNLIIVTSPFLTIAGQTAPSPGINLRNFGMYIDTHDVVIQHLRIREGDTHQSRPSYYSLAAGIGAFNIVFDHVSIGWAIYQSFAALHYQGGTPHPTRVAMLDSLIAFALDKRAQFSPSESGYGGGMGHMGCTVATCEYTYARNLFVHTSHRQPVLGVGRVIVVNNVVYGGGPWSLDDDQWGFLMYWQNQGDDGTDRNPGLGSQGVIVNTLTIPSTGTGSGLTAGSGIGQKAFSFDFRSLNVTQQTTKIWLNGNLGPGITGPNLPGQRNGIYWVRSRGGEDFSGSDLWYPSAPPWYTNLAMTVIPSAQVGESVLATAGARPLDRDSLDAAAVSQARAALRGDRANMGSRVTSPSDMGGQITLAVNRRPLTVPNQPHQVAPGETFRTNAEVWLEGMARAVEMASAPISVLPAPEGVSLVR
jgi:hypothetical protein